MKRFPLKGENNLGVYYPSLFCIKHGFTGNIFNTTNEFVVLHEYIHFLQDVSTIFGKMNICNFYNTIRSLAGYIYDNKDSVIGIPIQESDFSLSIQDANRFIRGNTNTIPPGRTSGTLIKKRINLEIGSIDSYVLVIDNEEYIIGSDDIIENMAYLIEREIYGDNEPAPLYPYKTIEILTEQLNPDFASDKIFIIALCELSLLSSNPAEFYFSSLQEIKKKNMVISQIEDLTKLINVDFKLFYKKIEIGINEANDQSTSDAISFLSDPFNADDFRGLVNWLKVVFNTSSEYRKKDFFFITRGILQDNPRQYYLGNLAQDIGIPPIMNIDQEIFLSQNSPQNLILFNAFIEFLEIFRYGNHSCKLYNGCLNNMKFDPNSHIVSEECLSEPWKKSKETKLCPLGILIHSWGLASCEYYYK